MKSLGVRLTMWYAMAATSTLVCLFLLGYEQLRGHLIHGLDILNAGEFEQIRARLGDDYRALTPAEIRARVSETADSGTVLFYTQIHSYRHGMVLFSSNLNGRAIPDVPHRHRYTAEAPGVGQLRAAEFVMPGLDVTIATSTASVARTMRGYVHVCLVLLIAMLGASVLVGRMLSEVALAPLRAIREIANRIRSDNLSERIPLNDCGDEFSELALLLNRMFDRLESSFAQVRRFTAESAHELRAPLAAVRSRSEELVLSGRLSSADQERVEMQLEELARISQIIDELLFLSRAGSREIALERRMESPEPFLRSFAQDALVLTEHHGLNLLLLIEGEGTIAFEEKRIRQVLLNLIANAIAASSCGGAITMRSRLSEHAWRVSVEDQGSGIPVEKRESVFERFVRLDNRGANDRGSGLGLAICRSIIELHQGQIWAEAGSDGRGLRVVFEIPSAQPPISVRQGSAGAPSAAPAVA
jgi:signal transduction histidine kinase